MPATTTTSSGSGAFLRERVTVSEYVTRHAETSSAIDARVATEAHHAIIGLDDDLISIHAEALINAGDGMEIRASVALAAAKNLTERLEHIESVRALAMVGDMPTPGPDDWKKSVGMLGDDD